MSVLLRLRSSTPAPPAPTFPSFAAGLSPRGFYDKEWPSAPEWDDPRFWSKLGRRDEDVYDG